MKFKISKKWCEASAKKEGNASVGAGLPSVLGLSKIKPRPSAFALARGWGSVSSDEVLEIAEHHAAEAARLQRIADYDGHTDGMRAHCAKKAAVEKLCSEVLLRHAVAMTERQLTPTPR